ncbi:transcriptional regulator, IclR family [Rhodococcus pyridinivorans]|uniref:IclR family transcriptional regulator domain-containing protein n=1 Tax=Rhodococcus TaxID=1827 RepID=UPI0007CD9648|nr:MULTISPECIES: IclR family transcriptional regulator C-terminal domain-containing protein [Rhodococcus]MBX4171394.1 helix-turn-helix domain-containing protein [Rhodococcus sp. DMU2021]SEB95623.1 transcriptional regulator, IclR family [Rhodococcus pyridinivorans]
MPSIDLGNGPSNDRDFIQSIERGFAVLHAFDDKDPNPSLAELAAKTDLSRPAVRRILLTLQKLGYVTSHGTRWSLTPRVLSIGRHYTESHTLVDSALPKLVEIAEHANESASLGVLDGTEVVYAARVPVRRIMSINVSVGTRIPAYATSMGRALLAWSPREIVDRVLEETEFVRFTSATIDNPDDLRAELAHVRNRGYAITSAELEEGLITIAAPVFDPSGYAVGVLACSTSTGRHTLDSFRDLATKRVVNCAERLSSELGYHHN